ncbi:MAG: hypothetical protein AAFQ43_02310 [Bacteroidota bacterium]
MRRLALAVALLALVNTPEAQPSDDVGTIVERLQASGLLPADLSYWDTSTRSQVLQALSFAARPEVDLPDSLRHVGMVFYTGAEPDTVLAAFADSVWASGAISERTDGRLRQRLDPEHPDALTFRFVIAQEAARLTEAEERFAPEAVAAPLDSLVALGALSPAERTALDARLARGEIETDAGLAAALPASVFVPDPASGETPEAVAERELLAVVEMLRQRRIAAFEVEAVAPEIVQHEEPSMLDPVRYHYDLWLDATLGGRAYGSEAYLDFATARDSIELASRLHRAVAPVVNKALRDAGAEQRVYAVEMDYHARQRTDRTGTVYVALTADQARVASTDGSLYQGRLIGPSSRPLALVSEHDVLSADTLSTERTAETLTWLRETGILRDTPDLAERLATLDRAYVTSPYDLLVTLDLVMEFDWEMGDIGTPYHTLLADLARVSSGRFAPEAVESRFDWEARVADLSFTLGGTRYATDLEHNGDWYDSDAFALIDRAMREQASGARLYSVVYGRYDDGRPMAGDEYLVLTESQAEALAARGWMEIIEYGPIVDLY